MIITNPNGLPQSIVDAVTPDQTRGLDPSRLSITDLINPPLMRILRQRHWHEMSETVDSRVWLLLGIAVHEFLDRHTPGASEVKFEIPINGFTLVGVIDLVDGSTIIDYKVTSVFSFLLGEKIEWEQQLNCYAYLLRKKAEQDAADFTVSGLKIVAILKDHKPSLALRDHEYPQSAFYQKHIRLWSPEEQDQFIEDRVEIHRRAAMGVIEKCTDKEKYHKEDTYAVKVVGQVKAKRVLSSMAEAEQWIAEHQKDAKGKVLGPYDIEVRLGEDTRCMKFCAVRNFCEYNRYLGMKAEDEDVGDD
jgi:hypothetical protein